MKFATPDEMGGSEESGQESGEYASVVDPTEVTVDLPELGTVTVAEALAEHDQEITVARGVVEDFGELHEALEDHRETILRQRAQIEELREAVEMLVGEDSREVEWGVEEWS